MRPGRQRAAPSRARGDGDDAPKGHSRSCGAGRGAGCLSADVAPGGCGSCFRSFIHSFVLAVAAGRPARGQMQRACAQREWVGGCSLVGALAATSRARPRHAARPQHAELDSKRTDATTPRTALHTPAHQHHVPQHRNWLAGRRVRAAAAAAGARRPPPRARPEQHRGRLQRHVLCRRARGQRRRHHPSGPGHRARRVSAPGAGRGQREPWGAAKGRPLDPTAQACTPACSLHHLRSCAQGARLAQRDGRRRAQQDHHLELPSRLGAAARLPRAQPGQGLRARADRRRRLAHAARREDCRAARKAHRQLLPGAAAMAAHAAAARARSHGDNNNAQVELVALAKVGLGASSSWGTTDLLALSVGATIRIENVIYRSVHGPSALCSMAAAAAVVERHGRGVWAVGRARACVVRRARTPPLLQLRRTLVCPPLQALADGFLKAPRPPSIPGQLPHRARSPPAQGKQPSPRAAASAMCAYRATAATPCNVRVQACSRVGCCPPTRACPRARRRPALAAPRSSTTRRRRSPPSGSRAGERVVGTLLPPAQAVGAAGRTARREAGPAGRRVRCGRLAVPLPTSDAHARRFTMHMRNVTMVCQ